MDTFFLTAVECIVHAVKQVRIIGEPVFNAGIELFVNISVEIREFNAAFDIIENQFCDASLFFDAFRKSLITARAFFSDNCLPKKASRIFFLHDSRIVASADAPHSSASRIVRHCLFAL